ncbi:MAG: NAD-dependent epimerase/dehydratase family protein [Paludibacteraceae bacterium]
MKILVTGANGLLGHHIVLELLKRNESVHIIVRHISNIYFNLSKVKVFKGDFTDFDILNDAAAGCDAIIHVAAVTTTNLLHYSDYERVNVLGSLNVIKVAKMQSINRIVFISSSNTIGYGSENSLSYENSPIQFPFTGSFYAQSKLAAEKLFIEYSKKTDKHIIIINSCFLIGGYDTKNSSGRLIKAGYKKPLLFIPKGGKNFVSADKVAEAACNALTLGNNGEKYLICGENLSFNGFFKQLKMTGNYKQKIIELPDWILIFVGMTGDLFKKSGIKTEVNITNIRQLLVREYYSGKKSDDNLKLSDYNLKSAINQVIKWLDNKIKV